METADEILYTSLQLEPSAFSLCTQPSLYTTVGTHAPDTYSGVTANTIATLCTIGAYAPAVLPGCLS